MIYMFSMLQLVWTEEYTRWFRRSIRPGHGAKLNIMAGSTTAKLLRKLQYGQMYTPNNGLACHPCTSSFVDVWEIQTGEDSINVIRARQVQNEST